MADADASEAPASTSPASSTRSTTWATRWARLRRIRRALDADGTLLLVEPLAGDRLEDNFHPLGVSYYASSTLLCVPNSLSQDVGAALGAQAGEARLREVLEDAGFARVRRACDAPFNLVLEARP